MFACARDVHATDMCSFVPGLSHGAGVDGPLSTRRVPSCCARRQAACESGQQHVVILVRNEGQSQLDRGNNMW